MRSLLTRLVFVALVVLGAVATVQSQETAPAEEGAEPSGAPDSAASSQAETPATVAAPVETIPVTEGQEQQEPIAKGDSIRLDDIQVTASKRVKSQRDLPGSVGAIRGEDLEKMRAQELSDYLKLIPGVSLADGGPDQRIPVIRGIASAVGGSQFTAVTTGIFMEEMPFNDMFIPLSLPDLNPFDVERVEVLKGPQGTLFGAGALAGAIRYIVRKPDLAVWQGKLQTTVTQTKYAGDLSRIAAAAINVPLFTDSAALRVVGLLREDAGLYDSLPQGSNTRYENDIDNLDQFTGRALFRWDATENLKLSAFYFMQDTEVHDAAGSANNAERPERNDVPFPSPLESSFGGGNFSAAYDFDWARLLYTGNVLTKDFYFIAHAEDAFPQQTGAQQDVAWYMLLKSGIEGFTHEVRLSSPEGGDDSDWEWLTGAAFMNFKQAWFQFTPNPGDADSGYYADPPEDPYDVAVQDRASSFLWATVDGDGTEMALFGEVTRRLGDYWEATLGARAFDVELIGDTVFTGAQIVALQGQTEARSHQVAEGSGVNPKVSLRYLHDRNIQAYLLASRGFQYGGFQISPALLNTEQATADKGFTFGPYKSSVLWNYELGLRTEWLDRRLRFDLAAFYLDWTDLQLTLQVPLNPAPLPITCCGIPEDVTIEVVVNVAAAHSEGLEAALEVVPFSGAKFSSSAAWISALTDEEFDPDHADGPVPPGTRLPFSPRFQWANVFAYERTLPYFSSWHGGFALTHAHTGEYPMALRNTRNAGGYDTLDARVTLERPGITWIPEINLGINNLTDVRGAAVYGGNGSTIHAYRFVRPRTTLLTLAWSY